MSSPSGDLAEARQMRTPIVATRVAKVKRAVREHGDGDSVRRWVASSMVERERRQYSSAQSNDSPYPSTRKAAATFWMA